MINIKPKHEKKGLYGTLMNVPFRFHSVILSGAIIFMSAIIVAWANADEHAVIVPTVAQTPIIVPEGFGKMKVYEKKHILLRFNSEVSETEQRAILSSYNSLKAGEIKPLGVILVSVPEGTDAKDFLVELQKTEGYKLEFAELDEKVPPSSLLNASEPNTSWNIEKIQTKEAWNIATGTGVVVGIADTGIDCGHPELFSLCVSGWNINLGNTLTADIFGHGTKVAGVVSTIAPLSKIMPLRVSEDAENGYASYASIAKAVIYAANHNVRVVNAGYEVANSFTVNEAAKYLRSKGGLFVSAAGNRRTELTSHFSNIITVGATDEKDNITDWSDFGNAIDITAPGDGIITTAKGSTTAAVSGTSFASANVAGVLTLIFSVNKNITPHQAAQILFDSAEDLGGVGYDMLYGYGRVNAFRALAYAALPPADSIPPTTPPGFEAKLLDGSRVALSWKESHDDVGVSFYEIFRDSVKIGETENTSYIDSKLETNAKYSYSVRARDAVQNVSVMSEIEEVTTLSPSLSVIYSSVVSSTNDSVVISWETNIPSYCSIYYGKNALEMPSSTSDSLLSKTHRVTIIELDPKTTYYYFIEAKDDMNLSRATSSIQAFRTRVK